MRRPLPRPGPDAEAHAAAEAAGRLSEPFGMFPPEVAQTLRRSAVHRCWRDGEVVLPADRVVPWILTVVRGKLRMATTQEDGRDVFFRWHGPGEMAGMISAVSDLPLPVDAVAYEHCETLHVERELLIDMMLRDGGVALAVGRR
jgi:CRP-like cAMP-binding protein